MYILLFILLVYIYIYYISIYLYSHHRLATMLRALALYHGKSPVHLFMVRLAQGLCHAGKGTVTLSPAHADRRLINQPALAGLLVVLTAFLDCKNSKCSLICE